MTAPSAPLSIRYRYLFTDIRSGALAAVLPLRDVSLSEVLGGPADGKAAVPLYSPEAQAQDVFGATADRRTALWAERQLVSADRRMLAADVVWSGIVMKRARSLAGRSLNLDLVTWEAYLKRRLTPTLTYTAADRFTIARDLVAAAVTQPGNPAYPAVSPHHAPLAVTTGPAAGVTLDRAYLASDLKPLLDSLTDLAEADDGFDWRLTPYAETPGDPRTYRVRLDLGYPRLGRITPADLHWSDHPTARGRWGTLDDATISEDGSAADNRLTVLGEGTGTTQLRAAVDADGVGWPELASGYPLYEGSLTGPTDLRTAAQVTQYAAGGMRANMTGRVEVSGLSVRGDLEPVLTRYTLGDDITLHLTDTATGQPSTIVGQLVGRTITPPQQGRTERVTMDLRSAA